MPLEQSIGYTFNNKHLLTRALTRKAYANEQRQQNKTCEDQEVLRTLGDAVLKTVLVDLLIGAGCGTREEITTRKMNLESVEKLGGMARQLGIGAHIILGAGEKKQKADEQQYVLSETLEAILGAVYLDGGFEAARGVITGLFRAHIQ
ncbi:MAG TPA: dsRNA-specific ribonuclease [Candidatus Methanoperedenaceae archaeon]|nr:dsRNA-specific ribonuclease [Candidatus Methanoperedenaceae archaeon]